LIDTNSTITNAVIREGSYVGESLDVANSIVDGHHLINLSLQTQVKIPDDHILSDLRQKSLRHFFPQLIEKLCATVALAILSPLALLPVLKGRLHKNEVVFLPAASRGKRWNTFSWLTFRPKNKKGRFSKLITHIPTLVNIIRGEAHFVGIKPRTAADLENTPLHWRDILLEGKVGLFTLCDLETICDEESRTITEAYYIRNLKLFNDIKILLKNLLKWALNRDA